MADEAEALDAPGDVAEQPASAGRNRRRLILIAAALLAVLGGVGSGLAWWLGSTHAGEAQAELPESFLDVEPMQVNLRSPDGATRFLKVHFMLVPGTMDEGSIKAKLPLVIDSYQPFLRELRPEDIAGAAATFRLKEELLVRANDVLGQGAVRDVLIQDLVQQ